MKLVPFIIPAFSEIPLNQDKRKGQRIICCPVLVTLSLLLYFLHLPYLFNSHMIFCKSRIISDTTFKDKHLRLVSLTDEPAIETLLQLTYFKYSS